MLQKNFKIKQESFYYEAYLWNFNINKLNEIETPLIEKNENAVAKQYSKTINIILSLYRKFTLNNIDLIYIWNWYHLYYVNNLYSKNLISKKNKSTFEKYNLITINIKSKQLRISLISVKNTIFNLTVGRVLSSLNINTKSKKKSNKGERLFIEYLENFLKFKIYKFGIKKLAIIKLKGYKKNLNLNETIYKLFNKNFNIVGFINDFKIPNNFFKFKKIRSIKRRLKKRIIKDENSLI